MERLKRRTDFRAAAEAGARASAKAFVLQSRARGGDDKDGGEIRLGFTVSRQVGDAVERNRVRRRLREVVRLTTETKLNPGHDYVLIGRRAALQTPFGDLMHDFEAALRRVHVSRPREAAGERTGAAQKRPLHKAGSQRPLRDRERRPRSSNSSGHEPKREPEIE
jgi:ribonuclease P protein component